MGTKKKIKIRKDSSRRKVKWAKPSDFTPEVWARLTSGKPLFPEKAKRLEEHLNSLSEDEIKKITS